MKDEALLSPRHGNTFGCRDRSNVVFGWKLATLEEKYLEDNTPKVGS
jgi:hypothetical protein